MSELPSINNVYGLIFANTSLERVGSVLRTRLGLTINEVYIHKSQFDKSETLYIRTVDYEFETQKAKQDNSWLLNGAVAGDLQAVLMVLKQLSDCLYWAGYKTKFEIYDDEFNCIAEYPEEDL